MMNSFWVLQIGLMSGAERRALLPEHQTGESTSESGDPKLCFSRGAGEVRECFLLEARAAGNI
jgi:hypothetical protein